MSFKAHGVEIIIIGLQQTSRDGLRLRVGISVSCGIFSLFDFLVIMMSIVITTGTDGTTLRPVASCVFVLSAGFAQSQQPAFVVYYSDSCYVKPVAEISMK